MMPRGLVGSELCIGDSSSADWGVNLSFLRASVYLWLNYHAVHHLFPKVDFCHHPPIQQIILQTCAEFNIDYVAADSPIRLSKPLIPSPRTCL